jgi:hypothetical protein
MHTTTAPSFNLLKEILTKYSNELTYVVYKDKPTTGQSQGRIEALYDVCRMFVTSDKLTTLILACGRKAVAMQKQDEIQTKLDHALNEQYREIEFQNLQDDWHTTTSNIGEHSETINNLIEELSK